METEIALRRLNKVVSAAPATRASRIRRCNDRSGELSQLGFVLGQDYSTHCGPWSPIASPDSPAIC